MPKPNKKVQLAIRKLRRLVPPLLPVSVSWAQLEPGDWGECELVEQDGRPTRFRIRLRKSLLRFAPGSALTTWAIDILMHEWAHARAWQNGPHTLDHGPAWGVAYAEAYRVVVGD